MNFVQPIRDPEYIRVMKRFLKEKSDRNYMLFVTGINSGLRISDILNLRVSDVKRPYFNMKEQKTQKSKEGVNKPIGRSMAYKILREAADYVSLEGIGTHTLRKTFGYHFYKQYKDPALLQEIFNHSSEDITLRYIGVNQDMMDKAIKDFKI